LEKFLAEKRFELLVNSFADRVIARAKQDEVHTEESGKKKKPVNAAKGKRKSPTKGISMTEDSPTWKQMRKEVKAAEVMQAERK
jgi:hypothetical protein